MPKGYFKKKIFLINYKFVAVSNTECMSGGIYGEF